MGNFKIKYTMIRDYVFLFCTCLCLVFQSCNSDQKKVKLIFNEVEKIVGQYPDSALTLLESVQNPYELDNAQYAKYVLLSVQARDKAYKDIASDTLIFQIKDYFQKENDLNNLALAEFYCGRVLQSQEKFDDAMKMYLDTKKTAEKEKNFYLCGLSEFFIGELNYNQFIYDEAIVHYENAVTDFSKLSNKYKNQIVSYSCIGNSFLLKESPDSAFVYYYKGLKLAEQYNDSVIQVDIIQNMGVTHLKLGNTNQAKILLRQALSITTDNVNKTKVYINLARISIQEEKRDSSLYYSNLALDLSGNNNSLRTSVYRLMSKIEESSGNYQKSLDYHKQYSKSLSFVLEEKENNNILDIQKKYDFELLQSANKKLVIQRLWILIMLILVIAISIFIIYRNRIQNKEALLAAKQQIYQLKEMVNKKGDEDYNSTGNENNDINDKLRNILFKQLDTFKKISLLERYLGDEEIRKGKKILEKVNEIIHNSKDTFDWEIFYSSVNALYDNFLIRLTDLFPALDKEDILICCLSKIGLDNTEIALLTKSNQNIIQKKKSAIRQKTGMEKQESFVKQLDEIVKK